MAKLCDVAQLRKILSVKNYCAIPDELCIQINSGTESVKSNAQAIVSAFDLSDIKSAWKCVVYSLRGYKAVKFILSNKKETEQNVEAVDWPYYTRVAPSLGMPLLQLQTDCSIPISTLQR